MTIEGGEGEGKQEENTKNTNVASRKEQENEGALEVHQLNENKKGMSRKMSNVQALFAEMTGEGYNT